MITQEQEKQFYEYLSSFQKDIHKLVASKRRHNHLMTVEEIVSDFNFYTINKKENIINYRDEKTSNDDGFGLQDFIG